MGIPSEPKRGNNMKRSKRIALTAFLLALTAIFCFVPIPIGPITLGLMILPTLIAAQTTDFKTTAAVAIFLGLVNQLAWYTTKAGLPTAPIFQNPLVCIVPRICIGLVAWSGYHGLCKLLRVTPCGWKKQTVAPIAAQEQGGDAQDGQAVARKGGAKREVALRQVASVIATACGVLTNTLLVGVFTVLIFNGKTVGQTVIGLQYILGLFTVNFVVEIISFPLITAPIAYAVDRSRR